MKLAYSNAADTATLTASNNETAFPISNVQNELLQKEWRGHAGNSDEWIVFDFGAEYEPGVIIIKYTGDAPLASPVIQGNGTDTWDDPGVEFAEGGGLTWDTTNKIIYATTVGSSARYWRFYVLTNEESELPLRVQRVFAGPVTTTTDEPDFDGYDEATEDNSVKQKSRGGQTFVDQRESFLNFSVKFSSLNNTDSAALKTYADAVGEHTSHFVQVQTASPLNDWRYVKLKKALGRKVSGFSGGSFLWDVKALEYEQQL
jgi:hypothetical protein